MREQNELLFVKSKQQKEHYLHQKLLDSSKAVVFCPYDENYTSLYEKLKENGFHICEVRLKHFEKQTEDDNILRVCLFGIQCRKGIEPFLAPLYYDDEKYVLFFFTGAFQKEGIQETEEFYADAVKYCTEQKFPCDTLLILDDLEILTIDGIGKAFDKAEENNFHIICTFYDEQELDILYSDEEIAEIRQKSEQTVLSPEKNKKMKPKGV